jgi:hypothetical protein
MGSPVVIGSYCSDFSVSNPTGASDFCFYVSTDGAYYLSSNTAMKNSAAFATNQEDDIKIIPSTFYRPSNGTITDPATVDIATSFRELKFKPIWDATVTGDYVSPIIPADERRFLSSWDYTTVSSSSEANRFVKLETKTNTQRFKFSGTAVTDATACQRFRPQTGTTSSSTTLTDQNIKDLVFLATDTSPTVSTSSTTAYYMVVKADWDNRFSATTSAKRLRYLVYDPQTSSGQNFRLVDLYDPDVSENTVKSCFYRITNGTYIQLTPAANPVLNTTTFTGVTRSTTWGIKGHFASSGADTRSVAFTSAPAVTIPATLNSTSDPTSAEALTINLNSKFFMSSTGTQDTSDFVGKTINTGSYSSDIVGASYTTRPNFEYYDHTNGFTTSGSGLTIGRLEIMFVTEVYDKRVEELFTNVNVTLLRLVQPSSGVPATSPAADTNNNYLGLEHIVPNNSPPTLTLSDNASGVISQNQAGTDGLIIRDYFKFYSPARATQFKFYDLGNGSEYLWQARWRSGLAFTFAYITVSNSNQIQYLSKITDKDQRGWILEYDTDYSPPAVRLKWAATGMYLDVNNGSTGLIFGTDSAPLRADGVTFTANKSTAAIFNCITCSSIDETGACVPITNNVFPGGIGATARSPALNTFTIGSPTTGINADSPAFRLKNSASTPNYIRYALSQFSSPTAAVQTGGLDASPSPTPTDAYISEFILTQRGGTMSVNTRNKKGFFIKANTTLGNYYLRADPNMGTVRMVSTNLPSDTDGYAWLLTYTTGGNTYNLMSVPNSAPSSIATTDFRFLNTSGNAVGTLSPGTTNFTYENISGISTSIQLTSDIGSFKNTSTNLPVPSAAL